MMKMKIGVLLCMALFLQGSFSASAQQVVSGSGSADILQQLKQFNSLGSVLYIAAHPDDENTRLLGCLVGERHLRTAYLSLTRGDGGQNLIGNEQGPALGMIRTQELLAARRIDGAMQFFTRAYDFGFSKTPDETFRFWNKQEVLGDVVWVIRNFKPDIIICRFPTTGEGGHGHHTASAILAEEAFFAAADPKSFPEQLKHTAVWQAKGLFWNTFNFGGLNTTSEDQIRVDVGTYNPLTGKSYGEIAAESRSMHKSQGFGSAKSRGEQTEYFKQLKGDADAADILKGKSVSWGLYPEMQFVSPLLDSIIRQYDPQHPEMSIARLNFLYKKIQQLNVTGNKMLEHWKSIKLQQLQSIIARCAGMWMEACAATYTALPGSSLSLSVQVIARNSDKVQLQGIKFPGGDTMFNTSLAHNRLYTYSHVSMLNRQFPYSAPYWLDVPPATGSFYVKDRMMIGKPENDPALRVQITCVIGGSAYVFDLPVVYKSTDPVRGEIYRPLEVLPVATVNPLSQVAISKNLKPQLVRFLVKSNAEKVNGKLLLKCSENWKLTNRVFEFKLDTKGQEMIFETSVIPEKGATEGSLSAELNIDDVIYNKAIDRIAYDHIPPQFSLREASVKLIALDIRKGGNKIAYIEGAGDQVPQSLELIGYELTILPVKDIPQTDLSQFDAVVTGVRAYNTHPELSLYHEQLMKYVQSGGNLLVQYNTNNRISSVPEKIGPYPFTITRDRVTDETASMRMLDPQHPLFNLPNKITDKDFSSWIQERGVYFAIDSANRYEKVFAVKDPNEQEQMGSVLVAPYGRGNFIYTGLAFFRQLPAGVPGAYRLFVNMLNMPAHEEAR